ncbi:MAG: site-2 protease family protein [Haloarculaceae archaeon]
MAETRFPSDGPPVEDVESVFHVADVQERGDELHYVGTPRVDPQTIEETLWPLFRDLGYEVTLRRRTSGPLGSRYVLVARPRSAGIDGIPWLNVVFFLLTVASTLFVGTQWYYIDLSSNPLAILGAWPFVAAILGVLAVHEMGHYVLIRYHGVDASLPYFIPFPSLLGTAGAVIRMRGRIPDRTALFDIGAAGPLAGLVATVIVGTIGLYMDPIRVPETVLQSSNTATVYIHYPLLLKFLAWATGQPLTYGEGLAASPVIFGAWAGMLVTFLNLLPVGQFDGGHIVRAILGPRQETVAAAVPAVLFGLAGVLYVLQAAPNAVVLWAIWGVFALGLAYAGPATPIDDDPLDRRRKLLGVITFALGLLCFTPIPIEIHPVPFALPRPF